MSEDAMGEFSEAQIEMWRVYEQVRKSGRFNMRDPRARRATGLSEYGYEFVMDNYSELRQQAETKK